METVEPTTIVVEADDYRVIPAGFADDVEDRTITNRHQLWNMLDEIEAVRHSGPYYRVRHFG